MDMTKEALQYINSINDPVIREIGGQTYSDKPLSRVSFIPLAQPIGLTTLTSLVEYIKSGVDFMRSQMIVHVQSPTHVELYSSLGQERERETVAKVDASIPDFTFGRYIDHESFLISLQAKFIPNEDRALLLKFAGTVEDGTVTQYGDDGVTQKATVKTGIASVGDAVVPNPVLLIPYRTFHEVEQPESSFVFRMRQDRLGGVECAIYEADGGAWENEAMRRVAGYLLEALGDCDNITVIY